MINNSQKLNPKLSTAEGGNAYSAKNIEMEATRAGFGKGLLEAGEADERVVGLCADLTESTKMNLFAEAFPKRFVEIGVAEQNLVTVASGMAANGKIPFVTSYAMFSPGRNWEQIRTTIAYNDRPVKIVGSHAGISVGPDGGTHQAIEDIALMRVLPNMDVVYPCDAIEVRKTTLAIAKTTKPTYLRLAREKSAVITTEESPFELGKANVLWRGENPQVVIIATGPLVYGALKAAQKLADEGVGAMVLNIHTIKPIDREAIIAAAKEAGAVVTVEEHQIAGGMGSAVAEVLAAEFAVPIEFIGVADAFGQSGEPAELVEHYGMGMDAIIEKAKKGIARKNGH